MLVSSPSPSTLQRPSPTSASTTSNSLHHSSSPSFPRRSSTSTGHHPPLPSQSHHHQSQQPQHYEPATNPVAASNGPPPSSSASPRVAIEELRSALTRHTVASSPSGPSGDLPCGRSSAGPTTLEGGLSSTAAPVSAVARPSVVPDPLTKNGSAAVPPAPTSIPAPQPPSMPAPNSNPTLSGGASSHKRNSPVDPYADAAAPRGGQSSGDPDREASQSKRLRPSQPDRKVLPVSYEEADPRDLVVLISSMLMELIQFNDKIPLHQGRLTRFHSRSPPRISVKDYLQRLTTHATLSPPILLSMVYYIDRLCALYPAFTVSSLTIHRFLIASATVASKGLSDSFWTNKTYSRVGGISMNELALLELEFLFRVEWRIVPQPEVLVDYYQSLVERCDGYEIQRDS
ncbi:cyclin-domain-containing protein [Aspergillus campestris IBT 28561]|uniref:Cyclin-domain-containing protein n=1 Tax=Aspergillus campestris (strain IBT 28561) TaxID=1392248 RepID=A0A2I1CXX3_ASPC2|nr:cyclin-domain-containing protein [Aspergillus campestris IBT 28561]PKY02476.1 cyclin-domain-containing protein [Aspergillus campestris IBT 28561]